MSYLIGQPTSHEAGLFNLSVSLIAIVVVVFVVVFGVVFVVVFDV